MDSIQWTAQHLHCACPPDHKLPFLVSTHMHSISPCYHSLPFPALCAVSRHRINTSTVLSNGLAPLRPAALASPRAMGAHACTGPQGRCGCSPWSWENPALSCAKAHCKSRFDKSLCSHHLAPPHWHVRQHLLWGRQPPSLGGHDSLPSTPTRGACNAPQSTTVLDDCKELRHT